MSEGEVNGDGGNGKKKVVGLQRTIGLGTGVSIIIGMIIGKTLLK